MKSIYLIAALALPLAACSTTSKSSVQPVVANKAIAVDMQPVQDVAVASPRTALDPMQRLEAGCDANPRNIELFQQFGLKNTCIAAASSDVLPEVGDALVAQDRATLMQLCASEDGTTPAAFVMPRGTWLEVIASGTEELVFAGFDLEVQLITCEVVAAPENRHVGQVLTLPLGWLSGRIVID